MTKPLAPFPGDEINDDIIMSPELLSWFNRLHKFITAGSSDGGGGVVTVNNTLTLASPLIGGGPLIDNPTIGIEQNGITNDFLAQFPGLSMLGNPTGSPGDAQYMSKTDVLTFLGGVTGFADPTAKVGPAAVPGIAVTAMRSDAAPEIDLAATYPWTGRHSFSPASGSGPAITANAAPGIFQSAIFNGSTTTNSWVTCVGATGAGAFFSMQCGGGTFAADDFFIGQNSDKTASIWNRSANPISMVTKNTTRMVIGANGDIVISKPDDGIALNITGQNGQIGVECASSSGVAFYSSSTSNVGFQMNSAGSDWGKIQNDGGNTWSLARSNDPIALGTPMFQWTTTQLLGRGPSAGMVDMTPDFITTTGTYTGCTTSPTVTVNYFRVGNLVIGYVIGPVLATSNATTFTLAGAVPAEVQPSHSQTCSIAGVLDNGTFLPALVQFNPGSSIMTVGLIGAPFTASGNKGFAVVGTTFSYTLA